MNATLSVILITKNEEQNVAECLASIRWANEIIVVDAESTDRTVEIARTFTPHVFIEPWAGFAMAKQFALDRATGEWILWIDADERVTDELAEELHAVIATNDASMNAYRIARRAFFLGKWIRHCGWYPGYVVRLFRRSAARFSDHDVHEEVLVDGSIGTLKSDMLHYTDRDLAHYFQKFNRYTSLAADRSHHDGKRASVFDIMLRPGWMFLRMYFFKLGFLDGMHGFVLSVLSASYVLTKYAKLWEKDLKE